MALNVNSVPVFTPSFSSSLGSTFCNKVFLLTTPCERPVVRLHSWPSVVSLPVQYSDFLCAHDHIYLGVTEDRVRFL